MIIARATARGLLLALAIVLCTGSGASAATVTEFFENISLDSAPASIAAGPDGNMWFTEPGVDQVAKITPAGEVTEYFEDISLDSTPLGIASGPDGNVWFTEYDAGAIAKIAPATGAVTEYTIGFGPDASPNDIVAGADGNLWYTDTNGGGIGRITTAGVVTEYPISGGVGLGGIAAGHDNKIWFTGSSGVGRIDPAAVDPAATITNFVVGGGGFGIATGPDGNLWATQSYGPIRRITPAGVLSGTFEVSLFGPQTTHLFGIAPGPDGNVWFTETFEDGIGRITPTGAVALVKGPIGFGSDPRDIATGPDGNLWFTQPGYDQVSRMTPTIDPPLATAADATAITTTTATLNGTLDTRGISTAVRFEYGPTTAYGTQTAVQEAYDTAAEPISAALTGLQPSTTYHYRAVALGGGGNATGADRTFTTATPPPPPPPPVPPVAPACSNGKDDDRDGFADAADARCHADGDQRNAASYRAQATTESPLDDPVVACSSGGLALTSVELTNVRRTIVLRGVTGAQQAGKRVGIYAAGRRVANPNVAADGTFRARFRAARRAPAQVRYQARLGAKRSQTLVAQRRFAGIRLSVFGSRVSLAGRIILRRPRSVELLGRGGGCGSFKRLATVRVPASGTFSLNAAAFTDVDIATYRVRIATVGAAGARESTPPRPLKLR